MLRMRTNQKQKDKMASWRKDLPDLPESVREEESDGDNSSTDISQAFSKRYSPDRSTAILQITTKGLTQAAPPMQV